MSLESLDLVRASHITEQECEWAIALKEAVAEADDIKNLSDFDYVQNSLIAKDDLESAMDRIRGIEIFREEYNINDTVEEGIALITQFLKQQPAFILTVDLDPEKGHFVFVYDTAKLQPKFRDFPEDWRVHLGAWYYLFHAMNSNIHSCRQGVVHIGECEGTGRDNFSMNHVQRLFSDLFSNYPFKHKEISWIRTPLAANLLYSFMKPLMRKDRSFKFQTGCTFQGYTDRLNGIFHIPNLETAEKCLLERLRGYLETRYHMEKNFKIPDLEPELDSLGGESMGERSMEEDSDNMDDENDQEASV